MQAIRLGGHSFNSVVTGYHDASPGATIVLQITCETIPLSIAFAAKELDGPALRNSVWIGPLFVVEP